MGRYIVDHERKDGRPLSVAEVQGESQSGEKEEHSVHDVG